MNGVSVGIQVDASSINCRRAIIEVMRSTGGAAADHQQGVTRSLREALLLNVLSGSRGVVLL